MANETSSKWGAEHFRVTGLNFHSNQIGDTSLRHAVEMLPARVKQAFYGAAVRKGVIHRSTWNGCAFNEGGIEVGDVEITSTKQAMNVFGISQYLVTNFIRAWDSSKYASDEEATQALIGILEEVGIFNDPERPKAVRIVNNTVFESTMTPEEMTVAFKEAAIEGTLHDWDAGLAELLDAAEVLVG